MVRKSIRIIRCAVATGFLLVIAIPAIKAQVTGHTCDTAARPCLDKPFDNQTEFSGRLTPDGTVPPHGVVLHMRVGDDEQNVAVKVDESTGKFSFTLPSHLSAYNTVEVFQSSPVQSPLPTTGKVAVAAAPPPASTCDKGQKPCINQPQEGDTTVSGTLDSNSLATGTVVTIKVPGDLLKGVSGQIKDDGFTFNDLHPLSQYDTVEVIETSPAANGPATVRTTGAVAVKAASSNKLTIPAASASLDFGHQAMETASAVKTVTLTNSTANDVDIADPWTTVTSSNYIISANSCVGTIPKKGSCSFSIAFAPFRSGLRPGAVEKDFVVLVPKNTSAQSKYQNLLKDLQNARSKQKPARQAWENAYQGKANKQLSVTGVSVANVTDLYKAYRQAIEQTEEAERNIEREFQVISLTGIPDHWPYPLTRAVVGVDLSAPSAQTVKQSYYVDFDLLAPLKLPGLPKNEDPIENRLWLWFNPRITSLPQAANFSALSTINETGSFFFQESSKGTLGDIQGLDVSGGLEIAIVKPRDGIPWWAEYANTQARISPSFIVGFGMSTPFSTDKTDVVSQVNQGICDAFNLNVPPRTPAPTKSSSGGLVCQPGTSAAPSPLIIAPDGSTKSFVDFFTPERSRFFRRVYGGVRLKTYFFSRLTKADCDPPVRRGQTRGDCDGLYNIFPGTIDLTFGKDEAVTAGHLSKWLFRIEANYPLPFYQGIHVFASMYTALQGNSPTQPYNAYTINSPATGANNDVNTFRYGLSPLNRDYYRIGIGVDLIQVFKKASGGGQPNSKAPAQQSNPIPSPTS
jgi:hypothetical protein